MRYYAAGTDRQTGRQAGRQAGRGKLETVGLTLTHMVSINVT